MTYFQFLLIFLVLPILVLFTLWLNDRRQDKTLPVSMLGVPFLFVVSVHVVLALLYTTPWDNYLVASGVWFYKPSLVAGVKIGWVPLEEYLFFVLQTILAGFWLAFLSKRIISPGREKTGKMGDLASGSRQSFHFYLIIPLAILWLMGFFLLFLRWQAGTYLNLILVWAFPPIALQLYFGADILWRNRSLILAAVLSMTLILGAADSLAIQTGTWTISLTHSTGILLAGVLPFEEFIFFLATNTLLVFGILLGSSVESRSRINQLRISLGELKLHSASRKEIYRNKVT